MIEFLAHFVRACVFELTQQCTPTARVCVNSSCVVFCRVSGSKDAMFFLG